MDLQDALVLFELLLFGILAASWLLRNKSRAALSRRPETPPAPPPAVAEKAEAFACEKFLQPYGGHAIYDAFIPITMIAYIFVLFCYDKKDKKD